MPDNSESSETPTPAKRIGFSGTQWGMTAEQRDKLTRMLTERNPSEFHHGDCMGADAQAHAIVREWLPDCKVVIHPPDDPDKRAWCKADSECERAPYLVRNRHIVDAVDELLAAPLEATMQQRGGTWSTVRYAKSRDIPCLVISPAGNVELP